jgi:hypothetical protein
MITEPIALALAAAALGMFAALALNALAPALARAWDKARASGIVGVFSLAVALAVFYAGGKSSVGSVTYPYTDVEQRYLFDAGSYVTNDFVHVNFTRSLLLPESADLVGAYRSAESTNDADWVEFMWTTFAAFTVPTNIPFAGAISNNFVFFTTWTPGPSAHTNGIAVIMWQRATNNPAAIAPIRTGIYLDTERLAPSPIITNGLNTTTTTEVSE